MRKDRPLIAFVTPSGGLVGGTAVLPASPRSAGDVSSDAKANLRAELLLGSTDDDPGVVRAAVGALAELDRGESVPILERAAQGADFGVRVRALSWLTQFGDVVAFSELAKMLSQRPFTPFTIRSTIHDDNDASLAIAYGDVIRSLSSFGERDVHVSTAPPANTTAFVKIMATLARSDDMSVRRAAFAALRGFKHPASFPVLIDALADEDEFVRYDAMFTLCMAMNAPDFPCPATPLFRSDEQKYIRRIRSWWAARQ